MEFNPETPISRKESLQADLKAIQDEIEIERQKAAEFYEQGRKEDLLRVQNTIMSLEKDEERTLRAIEDSLG